MTPDEVERLVKKTLRREREPTVLDELEELHELDQRTIKAYESTIASLRAQVRAKDETIANCLETLRRIAGMGREHQP